VRFAVYEVIFCLVWSLLQNAPHYGLHGFDANSDRVCAHTYIVGPVSRLMTFGSTSHFAHHVDMGIPGPFLQEDDTLREIEERVGVAIVRKTGIFSFVVDVLRQFKGPLSEEELEASWCVALSDEDQSESIGNFGYRRGRSN
jgi:fatty acid desaturase